MTLLRRLAFDLSYLFRPPWDSGVVPPEVEDYLQDHPPGRALDLGCGSGTSSLALARAGWQVTGVDFARRAVRRARRKARAAGLAVDFRPGDVTRLPPFPAPFDLVLDIGCFHSLDPSGKQAYARQLEGLLAPGGDWLLYGFIKEAGAPGPGLTEADLALPRLRLVERQDGMDHGSRPSAWFRFAGPPHLK